MTTQDLARYYQEYFQKKIDAGLEEREVKEQSFLVNEFVSWVLSKESKNA